LDAGYADSNDAEQFAVIENETRPPARHADNWDAAEALLSNDTENVESMLLYTLRSSDTQVTVEAKNMRRQTWNFQRRGGIDPVPGWRRSIFDGNGGYEWLLNVNIHRPPTTCLSSCNMSISAIGAAPPFV
jgi:hypothetical protein